MAEIRIGTSGWVYKDWKGPFYPAELKAKDHFAFYATQFSTTEINASFYRLPGETMVKGWAAKAPPGFLFAWKASQYITHRKRLLEPEESVGLVFERMGHLAEHFGPVLFQLPPSLKRDDERLARFLDALPRDRRHTVEFRHPSWYEAAVFDRLRAHDVSLCLSDHHHAPAPWEVTASWVYVRGHGPGGRYFGSYDDAELDRWAERLAAWRAEGRDAFCYFDNDIKAAAPDDAKRLLARVQPALRPSHRKDFASDANATIG
jgi:uncharacterized protein YecE (DUF72 family)